MRFKHEEAWLYEAMFNLTCGIGYAYWNCVCKTESDVCLSLPVYAVCVGACLHFELGKYCKRCWLAICDNIVSSCVA